MIRDAEVQPLSRVKCDISWDTKVPKRFWSPGLLKLSPVLWPAAAFRPASLEVPVKT